MPHIHYGRTIGARASCRAKENIEQVADSRLSQEKASIYNSLVLKGSLTGREGGAAQWGCLSAQTTHSTVHHCYLRKLLATYTTTGMDYCIATPLVCSNAIEAAVTM